MLTKLAKSPLWKAMLSSLRGKTNEPESFNKSRNNNNFSVSTVYFLLSCAYNPYDKESLMESSFIPMSSGEWVATFFHGLFALSIVFSAILILTLA